MTDTRSPTLLGTVTLAAGHDPEAAWPDIRDLGRAGGLAPGPAARFACAVTILAGLRCGPAMVVIAELDDACGRQVTATIHGGRVDSALASPGPAETSRRPATATGTVRWVLTVRVTDGVMTDDPAWLALDLTGGPDSRDLLPAMLAEAARHASRAESLGREVLALRLGPDENSPGLLPRPAGRPDQHDPAGPGEPGPGSVAAGPPAAGPPAAAEQAVRRLLYVDDNPLLTVLVERIFAADPAVTVQTAPDGRTALELAFQQPPDLVMLDLHLADISGETLLRQFRADPRTQSIPAVIVSGDAEPATIERLTTLGAIAYVTKPFTAVQIRDLVSQVSGPGHRP
jgi:CheY-like chemotaxis protein